MALAEACKTAKQIHFAREWSRERERDRLKRRGWTHRITPLGESPYDFRRVFVKCWLVCLGSHYGNRYRIELAGIDRRASEALVYALDVQCDRYNWRCFFELMHMATSLEQVSLLQLPLALPLPLPLPLPILQYSFWAFELSRAIHIHSNVCDIASYCVWFPPLFPFGLSLSLSLKQVLKEVSSFFFQRIVRKPFVILSHCIALILSLWYFIRWAYIRIELDKASVYTSSPLNFIQPISIVCGSFPFPFHSEYASSFSLCSTACFLCVIEFCLILWVFDRTYVGMCHSQLSLCWKQKKKALVIHNWNCLQAILAYYTHGRKREGRRRALNRFGECKYTNRNVFHGTIILNRICSTQQLRLANI